MSRSCATPPNAASPTTSKRPCTPKAATARAAASSTTIRADATNVAVTKPPKARAPNRLRRTTTSCTHTHHALADPANSRAVSSGGRAGRRSTSKRARHLRGGLLWTSRARRVGLACSGGRRLGRVGRRRSGSRGRDQHATSRPAAASSKVSSAWRTALWGTATRPRRANQRLCLRSRQPERAGHQKQLALLRGHGERPALRSEQHPEESIDADLPAARTSQTQKPAREQRRLRRAGSQSSPTSRSEPPSPTAEAPPGTPSGESRPHLCGRHITPARVAHKRLTKIGSHRRPSRSPTAPKKRRTRCRTSRPP